MTHYEQYHTLVNLHSSVDLPDEEVSSIESYCSSQQPE